MSMDYQTIRYELCNDVAILTLNRPEHLNAFTSEMAMELLNAFDRADADDAVRAVIVTGDGRAFCAGADLSNGVSGFHEEIPTEKAQFAAAPDIFRDGGGRVALRIFRCLKPVIAAINGPAVGVGVTMTLPMDIRLASEEAKFGFVFSRRGIVPEAASSYFLPRIVGISKALEWCYSGRILPATEAKAGGLVRDVYPGEELMAVAFAVAREIADYTAPVSIALTRQMLWRGLGMHDPMEAHRIDSRGVLCRIRSDDAAEGVSSFKEKRPPKFPDRVSTDMPDFFPWWEEPSFF